MKYVTHFVGHFDLNESLITDIRKLLRKSGFRLWVRGGNPNRKQHVGSKVRSPEGVYYTRDHNDLRQSIPLSLSTYGRFYLRLSNPNPYVKPAASLNFCKKLVMSVVDTYVADGIDIKTNVPPKF